MNQPFTRRDFLGTTIIGAAPGSLSAADESAQAIPTQILGKTRAKVTFVEMGCGSRWLSYGDEDTAPNALNLATDSGVSYLDTAHGYNCGLSET